MTIPSHLFLFNTGNPNDAPVFSSAGHFVINPIPATSESKGNIMLRALDNSWKTNIKLVSFFTTGIPREFNGVFSFTTITGSPPFPATLSFGPIAFNENIQIISDPDIINNPNLFAFVSFKSPPPI